MILDSITLENFGLYAGRQEIILTPPSTQKPIVLFGGLNGGGKTTLLDALQLGLFGQHAKTSNRGRLSYAEYLSRCIHVHEGYNFASVSLRFRHTIQGNEDHYTLKRRWERNKKGCNEVFDVLKNGRLAPDLSENWPSQVDVLMPLNIAHLFLFDGEKIERYASPSESANLVGTAIQNLLGLDVVNQLDRDIRVLERRKKLELSDNISRLRISEIEDAQKKLRDRITAAKQKRAAIRTHEIGKRLRQLDMAEREFRRLGGDLYERSKEFEVALRDADDVLSERSEALCEAASGALPLLLVTDLLRSGAERDLEDAEITKALQMHDLLVSRDTAVLKFLKSMGVEIGLLNQTKKFLDNDRANHRQRGDRKISLDLDKETRGEITVLLHGGLDDALKSASERLEHYQNAESEIEGLRAIRDSIPEEETIQGVIQKRNNLKEEVEALEAKDARLAGEINLLERERERGRRKIEMLYEENVKSLERNDDRIRILKHAARVKDTLARFRVVTTKRHVSRIEQLVLESFQHLLRKSSLVVRLSIDPVTFAVKLFGQNGKELPAETLSAGERQLLATALLWGLAKASGRPLPTAIDTPLGRLDTEHRRHFVRHYVPYASHQTLLFSTNEEIVGDYLEDLKPFIGICYLLDHDDKKGCTYVRPGYFGGERINHVN